MGRSRSKSKSPRRHHKSSKHSRKKSRSKDRSTSRSRSSKHAEKIRERSSKSRYTQQSILIYYILLLTTLELNVTHNLRPILCRYLLQRASLVHGCRFSTLRSFSYYYRCFALVGFVWISRF